MDTKLIPAILTYVREKGGYTTKTKLLKLLYLLDIEAFREQRSTLTGFDWIFYRYGPWSDQYDAILEDAQHANLVQMRSGDRPDLDTVFVDATERVKLSDAFPRIADELKARRVIEAWAERPTAELLDYVYFHTAPMLDAKRGDHLDFGTVLRESPRPDYKRTQSAIDPKERKRLQASFRQALDSARKPHDDPTFISPKYDSEYWRAVEILDRELD